MVTHIAIAKTQNVCDGEASSILQVNRIFRCRIKKSAAVLVACVLGMGALLVWWMVVHADREMRSDLLHQTRLVGETLNIDRLRALTGTVADLESPVYLRLKDQLATARAANPQCRALYLLGRHSDGSIFFFVDSEPASSKACSQAGQVYQEEPEGCRQSFATHSEKVEGPYATRWGTAVISGFVPILERQLPISATVTRREAQELVSNALSFYRKTGRERFLKELNQPEGEFCQGNLYAFVYDLNMTVLAHPKKPELIGKNDRDVKDWPGGKLYRREIQEAALTKSRGWVDYEHINYANKAVEPKSTYFERTDDLIVCAGAYKGTGAVLAVLGMDIDARAWNGMLVRAALPPALLMLALVAIGILGSWMTDKRSSYSSSRDLASTEVDLGICPSTHPRNDPGWMHHIESALTVAVGLAITAFAIWMVNKFQTDSRRGTFEQLADSQTAKIAETLYLLRDTELASLALFLEHSDASSLREFRTFSTYLKKNSMIQAWEWIPAVPEADKARFEAAARALGLTRFEIWQKDGQGQRTPATSRETYYPIFWTMPLEKNEHTLGYDLGSEPRRKAALEESARTGLVAASAPITLLQARGNQLGMLLCKPVFGGGEPKVLRGFALAVLRMDLLLLDSNASNTVSTEISLLSKDAPPVKLASNYAEDGKPDFSLFVTRPILAFGKTFAVTAYPGPGYPKIEGAYWPTALSGLCLTAALATVIGLVRRRSNELEGLVAERTRELNESEQSYHDQFSSNSSVMLLLDPKCAAIIDANAAAVRFYGYSQERLLAMSITDINTMSASEVRKIMDSVSRETGKMFQTRHRLADGSVRDVEVSSSCIFIGTRKVLHAIVRDVTETKRAEKTLIKRVELDVCLSQMIESLLRGMKSGDGFVEALAILGQGNKVSRTCLFQNTRHQDGSLFLRMVDQWSEKPTAFDPIEMPKPGILYPAGWSQIQKCLASGECYCGDVRSWGEEERRQPWLQVFKTFLFAPIYVELQMGYRFWGFLSFIQNDFFRAWDGNDIEIAKSAANLLGAFLTRSEEVEQLYLLSAAVDSAQESFVITDAQLDAPGPHILFANPAVEKLSGYGHDELLGRSPRVFQGPQTNREALRRLKENLPLGIPFQGITTNYRKDGTPYLVDWNIAPVRNREGKITHYVSVQRDITQQHAMEKRLAMASKMESVGSLAAGIAHEINSPAQFIGDNVQYAYDAVCKASSRLEADGISLTPKVANPLFEEVPLALKDALEGLSRIDKIVKSMREFAHPGEELALSDLNRCLETSVTVCRNEWKHVAQVDFDLDPNLPQVPCVRSDINQVVVNLVVNAAQAIAEQKRDGLGRIHLSTRTSGGWAELRVEDDGPGIPPEIAEKIFDPFFTTKPIGKGTGQGLFLAQQSIVGRHNGRISLSNLPRGGACFLIQLPLAHYPE